MFFILFYSYSYSYYYYYYYYYHNYIITIRLVIVLIIIIFINIFSGVIVRCASCIMRCPSTLETKYSSIFFYKTIAPTVLKFFMEHDLAPGPQNYKIGLGRISKMAAITKIGKKNNKIDFFPRITGYFWLNFSMEYQRIIGIQIYKNEKNLKRSFVTVTYFLFTSVLLLYLKITYLNNFKQRFFLKLLR